MMSKYFFFLKRFSLMFGPLWGSNPPSYDYLTNGVRKNMQFSIKNIYHTLRSSGGVVPLSAYGIIRIYWYTNPSAYQIMKTLSFLTFDWPYIFIPIVFIIFVCMHWSISLNLMPFIIFDLRHRCREKKYFVSKKVMFQL